KHEPAPVPLQLDGALPFSTSPPVSPDPRLPGAWSLVKMIGQSERPGALILEPFRKTSTDGEPSCDTFFSLMTVPGLVVTSTTGWTKPVPSIVMSAAAPGAAQQTSPPAVHVWLLVMLVLMTVPRAIALPGPWQMGKIVGLPARKLSRTVTSLGAIAPSCRM